jgi:hypothetical protein
LGFSLGLICFSLLAQGALPYVFPELYTLHLHYSIRPPHKP